MKISQLSTRELSRVLLDITPPLCRILRDETTLAALDEMSFTGLDAQPPLLSLTRLWERLAPVLLEHHAQDVCTVLSILTEKTADEIRQQPGLTTLRDLLNVWDEQLAGFFFSAGSAVQAKS